MSHQIEQIWFILICWEGANHQRWLWIDRMVYRTIIRIVLLLQLLLYKLVRVVLINIIDFILVQCLDISKRVGLAEHRLLRCSERIRIIVHPYLLHVLWLSEQAALLIAFISVLFFEIYQVLGETDAFACFVHIGIGLQLEEDRLSLVDILLVLFERILLLEYVLDLVFGVEVHLVLQSRPRYHRYAPQRILWVVGASILGNPTTLLQSLVDKLLKLSSALCPLDGIVIRFTIFPFVILLFEDVWDWGPLFLLGFLRLRYILVDFNPIGITLLVNEAIGVDFIEVIGQYHVWLLVQG